MPPSRALTSTTPAGSGPKAQEKAVSSLTGLMEAIAACRAEILRKESAAHELEKRLHADLTVLETQWINLRVQTFRMLGRQVREGRLNRRGQKILAQALSALADELESEYGVDLKADRRIFLGEDAAEPAEEEAFYSGRKPRAEARAAGPGREERRDGDETDFVEGHEDGMPGRGRQAPRGRPGAEGRAGNAGDARGGRPASKAAQKRAAKDQTLAGDIRALYLILARALHPDKEANPALREAKTVWMQKVTAAYAKKDLAMLLDILARNPLEAVGPYLSEAPLKTVQSFAKRLRRELEALRRQAAKAGEWLHPYFARFLKDGAVDEARIARHLAELKRSVRLARQRLDVYRTPEGVSQLIEGLRAHDWRDLI